MKDSAVLKRSMFSDQLPKSVRNSGIMAGFEDDDMLEAPPEEDTMPQMARTPQNPEILMNTLRGDMRSVDARYQELAQMVGEEAAQETPPEVLAMLQMQFGQQQGGIGALPQGAGMVPPPMESGAPMGAPGGAPAMPSPQGAMPPGMESAPPLPQGGADQAPQGFAYGGYVPGFAKGGSPKKGLDEQILEGGGGGTGGYSGRGFDSIFSDIPARPAAFEITPIGQQALAGPSRTSLRDYLANKANQASDFLSGFVRPSQFEMGMNQYLGGRTMAPQPTVSRLTGGEPAMNLTRQGRDTLIQDPATGLISQGTGTRLAPYTTMGPMQPLTFTQGMSQGLNRLVAEYPRVAALLPPSILAAAGIAGPNLTQEQRSTPLSPEEQAKYDATMAQIDAVNRPERAKGMENVKRGQLGQNIPTVFAPDRVQPDAVVGGPFDFVGGPFDFVAPEKEKTTEEFIDQALAKPKELSRMERIKAAQAEYTPLFQELVGDSAEDAKTNAMLLLADAGFKLASTYKPTLAMAVSEAAKDIPRGFANIIAQARDRDIKLKTAALTQAISDVQQQDQMAQRTREIFLKGDYRLMEKQMDKMGAIRKNGGVGLLTYEDKQGNYLGTQIDPDHPVVKSIRNSPYSLRETDNPFVTNRGPAASIAVEDSKERLELAKDITRLDDALSEINIMKDAVQKAYSPGTFFVDKINNILVPITPGLTPDLKNTEAVSQLKSSVNTLIKKAAAEEQTGRVSNYTLGIEADVNKPLASPAGFLENAETAAKHLAVMEANIRNQRQRKGTQLGVFENDYVMTPPNLGTANDPFVLGADPAAQKRMFNYLGSSLGRSNDQRTRVYVDMGPLGVQYFTPAQLRQKAGLQ